MTRLGRNPAFIVLLATGASFAYSAPLTYADDHTTHDHHSFGRCAGTGVAAAVFLLLMSLLREANRKTLNAIFVAGASGVYLSGGFGVWELLYPAIATPVAFMGLQSYLFIGIAWLMHSCWDIAHHLWGNPIWPFMPTSSFGCMIFDAVLAIWFIAGAPAIPRSFRRTSKAD